MESSEEARSSGSDACGRRHRASLALAGFGLLMLIVTFLASWAISYVHIYLMEIQLNLGYVFYGLIQLGPVDGVAYFLITAKSLPYVILVVVLYTLASCVGVGSLWRGKLAGASGILVALAAALWRKS